MSLVKKLINSFKSWESLLYILVGTYTINWPDPIYIMLSYFNIVVFKYNTLISRKIRVSIQYKQYKYKLIIEIEFRIFN